MRGRNRKRIAILLAGAATATVAAPGRAAESLSYRYDSHGRLIQVVRSPAANTYVTSDYIYDPADNRTSLAISSSTTAPPPPPAPPPPSPSPPPPPPPPPNHPPTAVNDSGTQWPCTTETYDVTANDSDPDGDPLILLSVTNPDNFWLSGNSITVESAGLGSGGSATYTVKDPSGATATAVLTVSVWAGMCEG